MGDFGVWRSDFKIRRKADIDEFLKGCGHSFYYDRYDENDYCINKEKNGIYVAMRNKSQRGNIFSPYICMYWEDENGKTLNEHDSAMKIIWRDRKYINEAMR